MGLRFRKSISIMPGIKLNLGKTGMSVSAGVPGFRKTFHTSGRVTTSIGIPGTGIYYVDTQNAKKQNKNRRTIQSIQEPSTSYYEKSNYELNNEEEINNFSANQEVMSIPQSNFELCTPIEETNYIEQVDVNSFKSIHKTSDDSIDWTEVLVSSVAPDESYNQQMWEYYHSMAPKVLSGDIDTYLKLIYEVNPLDDLMVYGSNFEFGTDNPKIMEVEFDVNEKALKKIKCELSITEYNLLLQDYVCSVCIRIARDMFALLPIQNTIVHAVLNKKTIISVDFDRIGLSKIKFGYIDPSDTLIKFRYNMSFNEVNGFDEVKNLS